MGNGKKIEHPVTIPRELYVDELEKASTRIGDTLDGVAIWFARFAQRNLQNLSTGEWTDLLYEVASLSEFQYQLTGERALWSHAITLQDWAGNERTKDQSQLKKWIAVLFEQANEGTPPDPLPPHTLPPRDAVVRLQEETITAFTELQEHRSYSVELPAVGLECFALQDTDTIARLGILLNPDQLFRYNLAWTIGMSAVRIRRCDGCQAWFFADRKNKTYCSSSCQSAAGTRRYRAKLESQTHSRNQKSKKGARHGTKKRKR